MMPTKTVNKNKAFRGPITKSLPEIKIIVHYVFKIVLIHSPHWRTVLFDGLVRKRKQIEKTLREKLMSSFVKREMWIGFGLYIALFFFVSVVLLSNYPVNSAGIFVLFGALIFALAIPVCAYRWMVNELKQRKASEDRLRESERRYRDLIEKSTGLICVHDLNGILVTINPTAAKTLGFEPEELIGRDISRFLPKAFRHQWADYLQRIETAKSDSGLVRVKTRAADERIWVYSNSLYEGEGEVRYVVGHAQDVTDLKNAESLSRRFSSIIEATSDFVGTSALDGQVLYGNGAMRELIGARYFDGVTRGHLKDCHPQWAAQIISQVGIPSAIENGTWRGETAMLSQDGREIPVSQVIIAHKAKDQTVEFLSTIARDITEEKAAEKRLFAKDAATRVLAQAATPGEAIAKILETVCQTLDWQGGIYWRPDRETKILSCDFLWHDPALQLKKYKSASLEMRFTAGVGLPGRVYESRKPVWIDDLTNADFFLRAQIAGEEGLCSAFAFPIVLGEATLGVIEFFSNRERQCDNDLLEMMASVGSQIGQFIERRKVEADMRESEARKSAILESAFDCIITIDSEGKIAEFNPAAEKTFAYKRDEVIGGNMFDLLVPPSIREGQRRGLQHYLATGNHRILGRRIEITAMRADGSEFPVELAIAPIQSASKNLLFTGFLRDITERKRAEKALQQNNRLLKVLSDTQSQFITEAARKALFDGLLEGLLGLTQSEYGFIGEVLSTTGGSLFVKSHAITNLAWDKESRELYDRYSAIGMEFRNLKPVSDEALATGKPVICNSPQICQWGNDNSYGKLPLYSTLCLPVYSGEKLVGMIGIANRPDGYDEALVEFLQPLLSTCGNIIQANRAEERRRAAEEEVVKLSLVASKTDDAVVITNHRGLIEWVNESFVRLTGYRLEEVQGKKPGLILQGPGTNPETVQRLSEQLRSKIKFNDEILNYRKDGRPYWVSLSITPIFNDRDELVRFISVQTDITERKFKQEELRFAKETAEAASIAKSQFLAVMSHEIRTPLNAIIGMTDLALHTRLAPEQFEFLKTVQSNSESLLSLINDILDFSKIEAGQMDIDTVNFKPRESIEDVAELLNIRAGAKGLEFICDIGKGLPSRVSGDPNRLRQILMNLVNNAIKFTESGEVIIKIESEFSADQEAVEIHCAVSDTGIGIEADKQAKIFERFYQADDSTTRKYGGAGLGLSISRLLVELMQGQIWFESEPGIGSTFHFRIPFKVVEQVKQVEPRTEFQGVRVLLVDDNQTSLCHCAGMLKELGLQVDFAMGAQQALNLLGQNQQAYSIVFLDKFMLDLDGLELARIIRQTPQIAATSLILMSPLGLEDGEVMRELNIACHLPKPIIKKRLIDGLETALRLTIDEQEPASSEQLFVDMGQSQSDKPFCILLVEDNKDNQNLAQRILHAAGYSVDLAENGGIAVERARDYLYDLILMDVQMPLMDGLDATRAIRQMEKQRGDRRTPIIALTAHAIEGYREKCLQSGMDDYLTKPIKKDRLLEKANEWIDRRPVILVVDDSAPSQMLIRSYLKNEDCQLFFANNGQQGLDFFKRHWVSLVLLDMEMPVLDGYATAKAIRQLPIGATLPIIAMTGHEGIEEKNKCLASGCSDYLGKPLRKPKILEAINQNLYQSRQLLPESQAPKPQLTAPSNGSMANLRQEIVVYVEEDIEDLVPEFLEGRHDDVKAIKESIQKNDFVNIQRLGHDMKGCGQGYGFDEISVIGKHIEAAAKVSDAREILSWNERLENYLGRIRVLTRKSA
jgi:two-component system, sensor histidine kinase and response regulator